MHPEAWTLKVEMYAGSFDGLKAVAESALKTIGAAKSFKDYSTAWGGGGGAGVGSGCTITCSSPVEGRIKQLRKEADDLETQLRSPS
jgi:hypothetical protein